MPSSSVPCHLLLLVAACIAPNARAQHEGDYLHLFKCDGSEAAELFEQHHEILKDGRNWTSIRPQNNVSLCVTVCANCDPTASGGYGRLQLQQCQVGNTAQAWSLVAGGVGSVQIQTNKAFVQSSKCVGWNINPASSVKARPFANNDTMIPYPGCSTGVPIWNEDMTFVAGLFRPSSAPHNHADVCVQAAAPPPPPPKPPGWAAIPLPSKAQLEWSRHEITAIGHYLPLCGRGDMQNASSWQSRGCSPMFSQHCLPAAEFNPKAVDTDGWVQAVAAMGAKGPWMKKHVFSVAFVHLVAHHILSVPLP